MEFWEKAFNEKKEIWGMKPANAACQAAALFHHNGHQKILIPGIGYGRNAGVFIEKRMNVTGIEISRYAIQMANTHFGDALTIFHGSVADMPFDEQLYDGIFCHALIHLLDELERHKLISDCYNQLQPGGTMIFTAITMDAQTFGTGTLIGKNRYSQFNGVNMFYYDEASIPEEFGNFGLIKTQTVHDNYPLYFIQCQKS